MQIVYNLIVFITSLLGVALIAIITVQESKNEGLTGQIGTTAASSFKGKTTREERLNLYTRNIAIAFFVLSALVFIGSSRFK